MSGRKLAVNVIVDGKLYPAGSSPDKEIADRISNPKAWGADPAEDDGAGDKPAKPAKAKG